MPKTILHILPSSKYFEGVTNIFKTSLKSTSVIYVTTNKPYKQIVNLFKKSGVKTDNIFFIDCISKTVKEDSEPDNCLFLQGPEDITNLGIAISKATKAIKGEKTVLFDSLSTLLVYNNENVIGKFSNFIINKLKSSKVSTFMLALDSDTDKKVIKMIESFADEVKK